MIANIPRLFTKQSSTKYRMFNIGSYIYRLKNIGAPFKPNIDNALSLLLVSDYAQIVSDYAYFDRVSQ